MHYDKRTSLALGILLVGVAAALFFRHESGVAEETLPQLIDAKSVDDRIAEKPVRPYRPQTSHDAAGVKQPNTRNETDFGFSFDGFSVDTAAGDGKRASGVSDRVKSPQGPTRRNGAKTAGPPPTPNPNAAWKVVPGSQQVRFASRRPRESKRTAATKTREYRVKSGDTLTGIAARLLGSSRMSGELLRVNRRLLKSPRDLRPGMTLQIPARTPNRKPADDDKSATTRQRNAPISPGQRAAKRPAAGDGRFRPVRRSPFILRPRESYAPPTTRVIQKPPPRSYVVRRGDSLERIARRFYGTRRAIPAIIRANGDRLLRPDQLRAGMRIVLP
ncbi:MAG: LysM peptidoglycan-binding domain-containing protein [Planctomycetaceae bacterium]